VLNELERKLTAVAADALSARADLDVVQAVGEPPAPAAGRAVVAVGLTAAAPEAVFAPETVLFGTNGGGTTSRRTTSLGVTAGLAFARQATAETPAALADARTLLLEDASIVAHAFADVPAATGAAFVPAAPDPGFAVHSFALASGAFDAPREGPLLRGLLSYAALVSIWPPGSAEPEGRIDAVDPLVEALPLAITADDPLVAVGGSTIVRVRSVTGTRLAAGGARTVPQLALVVVSDLPPAERGAIASGAAGAEPGLRLVPVGSPETSVAYQAPTGDLGTTRSEVVAVHLARADGSKGQLLGSIAILLAPGGP
jgi:hypothetical protein